MFTSILKSGFAGLVATVSMTAAMFMMKPLLPWWDKSPLPPHEVTSETLKALGLEALDEKHHQVMTVIGHFSYGAVIGLVYPLFHRLPAQALLKGALYGLGVWMVSYMGWIPAMGLLRPPEDRPLARNLLMIVAHFIWGGATGVIFHRMNETTREN